MGKAVMVHLADPAMIIPLEGGNLLRVPVFGAGPGMR
jgi:hypothetical protein